MNTYLSLEFYFSTGISSNNLKTKNRTRRAQETNPVYGVDIQLRVFRPDQSIYGI